MFAEYTSEVVDAAFDDFQWATAVLLFQPWLAFDSGHSSVEEIYWVLTDSFQTGGFPQCYLVLRERASEETWQSDLGVSPCIEPTSCRKDSPHSPA